MSNEILSAIQGLQDKALTLTGIRKAPDYVPGKAPEGIFAIAMPGNGTQEGGPGRGRTGQHVIRVFIGKAHQDLVRDLTALMPYGDSFPAAVIADPRLGNLVTGARAISYTFIDNFDYNHVQHIGWMFEVTVKQVSTS